jgi:hypothetical protein
VRGALSHSKPGAAEISGWRETEVRGMVGDSFAAVFESGSSALTEVGDVLGGMLPGKIRTLFDRDELLTGREIVLLLPDSAGRPALLAGVELVRLDEGAKLGDDAMDAMLELVGVAPRGFAGIAPLAVRRVNETAIALAWAYAPVNPADQNSRSWWIHTTDPDRLDDARVALPGLTPEDGGLRAFVSLRPALLVRVLSENGNAFPEVAAAFSRIESVEWIEGASPEKVLDGRLTVRFAVDGPAQTDKRRAIPVSR